MGEDLNLFEALGARGFKQQDVPGLPKGITGEPLWLSGTLD